MYNVKAEALELIRIVTDDKRLPRFARGEASRLVLLVASRPEVVWDRLERLRESVVPDLPMFPVDCDYARCVSVAAFWRHHMVPSHRDLFRHHGQYQRFLESRTDPAAAAYRHLADGTLVPAPHSWLVPAHRIAGLSGAQTRSKLLMKQKPPYLVMMFPMELMRAVGVEVREPRGLDVVPGRFLQWVAGDVAGERIDEDIPVAALGGLEWRP